MILLLLIPFVSAQDEEQVRYITPKAGITPDSIFYKLDVFFDNLKAALTPSFVGRATARLDIMEERMAEMEEMASKNKTSEAKKAILEGQKQMEKFERSLEKIKKKDAPELKEQIQIHAERLKMWKQRLSKYDIPDYADAMAEAIVLLETTENVIVNIPEDLGPDSTFIMSSICKEAGATTIAECNKLISSGALTASFRRLPENHTDPHNCSGYWRSFVKQTKWCCDDSDGTYSPEYVEHILSGYDEHVSDILRASPHMLDYYYRKGTVEYKIINLKTEEIEEGIETDSCNGNTLTEWFCPQVLNMVTRNERYSEEYDCPYGCQDGLCIPEEVLEEVKVAEGVEGECIDTDGGIDYFVKGVIGVSAPSIIHYYRDSCFNDFWLRELSCGVNNEVNAVSYLCPNTCQDGVCIGEEGPEEVGECTDSDGGMDHYVKGIITIGEHNAGEDYCIGDSWLNEYSCGDDNAIRWVPYPCQNGCQDGVCISGEVPDEEIPEEVEETVPAAPELNESG